MSQGLQQLVRLIHEAQLALDGPELADALWLARQLGAAAPASLSETPEPDERRGPSPGERPRRRTRRSRRLRPREEPATRPGVSLYADETEGRRPLVSVSAPPRAPLPDPLGLTRALRPFRRRAPSRTRTLLDIEATIRRIVSEGLWEPVVHPAPERWLDAALVIDQARSMDVWQPWGPPLRRLLARCGAFRQVAAWRWSSGATPADAREARVVHADSGREHRARDVLSEPGRQVLFVFSDCVETAWHDGRAARLLGLWGRCAHAMVLQPLPESFWPRTALDACSPVELRTGEPGAPNGRLAFRARDPWEDPREGDPVPVPVSALQANSLLRRARFAAAQRGARSPGFGFPREPLDDAADLDAFDLPETAAERVHDFLSVASPEAFALAKAAAAATLLDLPVLRILRSALLGARGGTLHEAELLISGLLRVVRDDPDPERVRYEFVAGAREYLLGGLAASVAQQVLELLSRYVSERLGQAPPADANDARGLNLNTAGTTEQRRPLARVTATVLQSLGVPPPTGAPPIPAAPADVAQTQQDPEAESPEGAFNWEPGPGEAGEFAAGESVLPPEPAEALDWGESALPIGKAWPPEALEQLDWGESAMPAGETPQGESLNELWETVGEATPESVEAPPFRPSSASLPDPLHIVNSYPRPLARLYEALGRARGDSPKVALQLFGTWLKLVATACYAAADRDAPLSPDLRRPNFTSWRGLLRRSRARLGKGPLASPLRRLGRFIDTQASIEWAVGVYQDSRSGGFVASEWNDLEPVILDHSSFLAETRLFVADEVYAVKDTLECSLWLLQGSGPPVREHRVLPSETDLSDGRVYLADAGFDQCLSLFPFLQADPRDRATVLFFDGLRDGFVDLVDAEGTAQLSTEQGVEFLEHRFQLEPRAQVRALAEDYAEVRATMSGGDARTNRMEQIALRLRQVAPEAKPWVQELMHSELAGERLAATIVLQYSPQLDHLPWLAERLDPDVERPFLGYHAALALRNAVHRFGRAEEKHLRPALDEARRRLAAAGHEQSDRARVLMRAEQALG